MENQMLNHYKGIVKEYLKNQEKNLYKSYTKEELDAVAERRAKNYLEQMENSSDPQQEKEIYFQEMLTF